MTDFDKNKIRRLDGALLLIFRELLRRRRATEVAEHLGLSPSAISHALTRLRDLFDDQLFIRKPHGLEPTRRALELGPQVEALIDLAGTTLAPQSGFVPSNTERRFSINSPEFVTAMIGSRLIEQMSISAPKASFAVRSLGHEPALDALRRGEIDLALGRFGSIGYGLTAEPLYQDRFCVVARKDHPQLKGAISLDNYRTIGHVIASAASEKDPTESVQVQNWLGEINIVAVVPLWLTALVMVSTTDGHCNLSDASGTTPSRRPEPANPEATFQAAALRCLRGSSHRPARCRNRLVSRTDQKIRAPRHASAQQEEPNMIRRQERRPPPAVRCAHSAKSSIGGAPSRT